MLAISERWCLGADGSSDCARNPDLVSAVISSNHASERLRSSSFRLYTRGWACAHPAAPALASQSGGWAWSSRRTHAFHAACFEEAGFGRSAIPMNLNRTGLRLPSHSSSRTRHPSGKKPLSRQVWRARSSGSSDKVDAGQGAAHAATCR